MTKNTKISEATPLELKVWAEADFFIASKLNITTLFVIMPVAIQTIIVGAISFSSIIFGDLFK